MRLIGFLAYATVVLTLVACVGFTDKTTTTFEKVAMSYDTAVSQIAIYESLPECSVVVKTLCHKPATVEKLQGYLNLVGQQVELARSQIAAGQPSIVAEQRALTTLGTLFAIFAAQALSKQ